MTSASTLGFVAAWFVLGQARIVFTSKMAEHRIDIDDTSQALEFTRAAAAARRNAANYDAQGRRLLPWYLTVTRAYWLLVTGIVCWATLGTLPRVRSSGSYIQSHFDKCPSARASSSSSPP